MQPMVGNSDMNPLELARKIQAVIADYDANTATTALEIAKLLLNHRSIAEIDFKRQEISAADGSQSI
jgi:hypothetical protein